ncbi:MAG: HAMP domain-containing sensor histidine kinase [Campylobacterota bacterium]|nr:HAMP domain-containing sensor histidine kinase [Campylobacterota bacterium]
MLDKLIEKGTNKLSLYSSSVIITFATISVVVSSVPLVYVLITLFGVEYTTTILIISIAAPALMVPPTIAIIIRLSKHLQYFQDELEKEVEDNKKKDILLFEQARFVLMGEMMANISHQWKQPLNTISLSVVGARMANKNDTVKYFDIMEDNVSYLASTIDDFMSFFDKKTHVEIRDLEDIISEIRSIIQVQIENRGIVLEIEVDSSYGDIKITSSISQVLLNLLNNAKDSFNDTIDAKKINLKFISMKDGLEIVCCDNGIGIKPEIRDKIFDPYFTTKNKNQGTGIGLYVSKQIIQKNFCGDISLRLGQTCFCINIPYSDKCILKNKE